MGKKKAPTRKSSRGLRGNSHSKQVKSLVLFAVEGATEKEYLKALNQHRYRGAFALDFCGSGSSSESSLKNLLVNVKRKASDLAPITSVVPGSFVTWMRISPMPRIWRSG